MSGRLKNRLETASRIMAGAPLGSKEMATERLEQANKAREKRERKRLVQAWKRKRRAA